ncbi:hypothetical protein C1H46_012519 [Malus baccata]|uniref:Uncharacterized protein n=1 Tax=Malus baccata TaxID=106549 RepID=A0A540MSW5_MALBA|nr:hypothetical protein C1H46_012519 [Malus baccata]
MVEGEAEEGPAGAGPALKPRERTSMSGWWVVDRPVAAALLEEDEPTQSAKAPESEGSLLVVATTTE